MSETFDLFTATTRPAAEFFADRQDVNDRRLGEFVSRQPAAYQSARTVMLGCPQDEGVRRNRGRVGAAEGPSEIRRSLYRLSPLDIDPTVLFDLGDTRIQKTLEETHELHFAIVRQLLDDGKRVIVLGGGNDLSYPDCAALAAACPELLVFNIDAHFDVRADVVRNSGTPYRQLLDEGLIAPGLFFEMGYQPAVNSPVYLEYLRQQGVGHHSLHELQATGVSSNFRRIVEENEHKAIFWGFDLDAVRAADAPGVSAPSPLGLTAEEFCDVARLAGSTSTTRIAEFTEVNPNLDRDHQTSRLTAFAIHHFLAAEAAARQP